MAEQLKDFLRQQIDTIPVGDPYRKFAAGLWEAVDAYSKVQDQTSEQIIFPVEQESRGVMLGRKLRIGLIGQLPDSELIKVITKPAISSRETYLPYYNEWKSIFDSLDTKDRTAIVRPLLHLARINTRIGNNRVEVFKTIGDVRKVKPEDLTRYRGLGPQGITIITEAFKKNTDLPQEQDVKKTKRFLEGGE